MLGAEASAAILRRELVLLFLSQRREGRHAENAPAPFGAQALRAQNHVERLVPGHVDQREHRGPAFDLVADDDVEAAGFGDQAEYIDQVSVAGLQGDGAPVK